MRIIWKGIKEIINIKSKSNDYPTCLSEDGKCVTNPQEISTKFNKYFTNIAEDILKQRNYEGIKAYSDYLSDPIPNSLSFEPTDNEEVLKIISQFKINKALGPMSIPSNIIPMIKDIISDPIAKIANLSFLKGTPPDNLKLAKVIPIYKKGSKLSTCNYRPISLLSNINKIFEKIIFSRVYSFSEKNKSLYNLQFGFRAKHSTTHALISITEQIRTALDNKRSACGVFVDFQKAFDTVNHNILLKKLSHYGIRGPINDWFKSYLQNRKQYVSILGYDSPFLVLSHGVPQGSVLGPLLFLIYINDLHKAIKYSTVYHFADDTNLLRIDDNIDVIRSKMNKDLKRLYTWLLANKISLNVAKTEVIFFKKHSEQTPSVKIKLNGATILPSKFIKYLGVYLDDDLSGMSHCRELIPKLRRSNGMLSKARDYVSLQEIISLYYGLFSSNFFYGCQIWGLQSNILLDKLDRLQKRAMRLITFSGFRDHTNPILKELKIIKIRDQIQMLNSLFIHDWWNKKLPPCFENFFEAREDAHSHLTRAASSGEITERKFNSKMYGRKSITCSAAKSWNYFVKLFRGINLKSLPRHAFKKLIKDHLLDTYA